jgi:hypothetical protein
MDAPEADPWKPVHTAFTFQEGETQEQSDIRSETGCSLDVLADDAKWRIGHDAEMAIGTVGVSNGR